MVTSIYLATPFAHVIICSVEVLIECGHTHIYSVVLGPLHVRSQHFPHWLDFRSDEKLLPVLVVFKSAFFFLTMTPFDWCCYKVVHWQNILSSRLTRNLISFHLIVFHQYMIPFPKWGRSCQIWVMVLPLESAFCTQCCDTNIMSVCAILIWL